MLPITIPDTELWDEQNKRFIEVKAQTLKLEHSLVSLSKWESKWHKSFLHTEKTEEELLDYIKFMTLTQNVDPNVYLCLNLNHINKIRDYINNPMTATTVNENKNGKKNREIVTSEVIYYWMIALNIPFECQKWHLNRLITLVKVCNAKNEPPKKRSKREIMEQNAAINAARRKRLNTKG